MGRLSAIALAFLALLLLALMLYTGVRDVLNLMATEPLDSASRSYRTGGLAGVATRTAIGMVISIWLFLRAVRTIRAGRDPAPAPRDNGTPPVDQD